MGEDVLVAGIIGVVAVLIVTQIARLLKAGMQHRTIREAISRDNNAVPELLSAMEAPPRRFFMDESRIAFVLIALGVALVLAVALQGNMNDLREVGGLALFPLLVGGALLLHRRLYRRSQDAA